MILKSNIHFHYANARRYSLKFVASSIYYWWLWLPGHPALLITTSTTWEWRGSISSISGESGVAACLSLPCCLVLSHSAFITPQKYIKTTPIFCLNSLTPNHATIFEISAVFLPLKSYNKQTKKAIWPIAIQKLVLQQYSFLLLHLISSTRKKKMMVGIESTKVASIE